MFKTLLVMVASFCLFKNVKAIDTQVIACDLEVGENCVVITAYNGINSCYELSSVYYKGYPFVDKLTSFQVFSDNVKGVILYDEDGCQGDQHSFNLDAGYTSGFFPYIGDAADNKANSFSYIPFVFAEANLCNDQILENCQQVLSTNGLSSCYNLDLAHNDSLSSFQLFSHDHPSIGLTFFDGGDCEGEAWDMVFGDGNVNGAVMYVGDQYDNRASSFKFIPQPVA